MSEKINIESVTQEQKDKVVQLALDFMNQLKAIDSESLFQDDNCHLEAPQYMCQIVDVLKNLVPAEWLE